MRMDKEVIMLGLDSLNKMVFVCFVIFFIGACSSSVPEAQEKSGKKKAINPVVVYKKDLEV